MKASSKKDGRAELAGLSKAKTESEGADGSRTPKLATACGGVMRFFVAGTILHAKSQILPDLLRR
ncbi:MAG: hypothetical protein E7Z72_01890 [Methanocorpusculum parvum]|nr:hypothetical protein [Methanocorpusculum parvum]